MDRQEVEWQYEAPCGLEEVEEWLGGPGGFGLAVLRGSLQELTDTYYDTEDRRLYRAGYALRVRRDALNKAFEATIKSPISGAAGNLHRRHEISEPLRNDEINTLHAARGPVGVRLRALVDPSELRPIFEVRTRRRTFDLLIDGQPADPRRARTDGSASAVRVGEVALDDSEIPLGDGSARLTRVEVEIDASATVDASRLKGFVKAMEGALGLRPATISKYEAGLFATGQDPSLGAEAGGKRG